MAVINLYRGERHQLTPGQIDDLLTDPQQWVPRMLLSADYAPAWWFHNDSSSARFYANEAYDDEDWDDDDGYAPHHPVIFHAQFTGPGRWREQNLGLHGGEGQHLRHGTPLQLHGVDVGEHHIPLDPPIPLQVANGFDDKRWAADPRHQPGPDNPVTAALGAVRYADAIMATTDRWPR